MKNCKTILKKKAKQHNFIDGTIFQAIYVGKVGISGSIARAEFTRREAIGTFPFSQKMLFCSNSW